MPFNYGHDSALHKPHPSTHGNTTAEHVALCRDIADKAKAQTHVKIRVDDLEILHKIIGVSMPQSNFENTLATIASIDVKTLVKKDAEYGSSWKKRGGVGAFMMLARKWDRLETRMHGPDLDNQYDVFEAITNDAEQAPKDQMESTLETIRDLRRYLLLVESEIYLRKQVDNYGTSPLHDPAPRTAEINVDSFLKP